MSIESNKANEVSAHEATADVPQLSLVTLYGNASPEEALVIGFAETHKQATHYVAISERITALAQPGDVLLVEGVQRGEEVREDSPLRSFYRVPSFVKMEGWDDLEAAKAAGEIAKEMFTAAKAADQARGTVSEDEVRVLSEKADSARVAFLDAAIKPRNPSLLGAVTDSRTQSPQHRTFVIAGARHFVEDPALIEALSETRFTVLKTHVPEVMQQQLAARRQDGTSIITNRKPAITNRSIFTAKKF